MKGTMIISLDFELFWGMHDCSTLKRYGQNILGARKAIPKLLDLMECYNIHATWAAVGLLFASSYEEASAYFPEQNLWPTYNNKNLSSYRCMPYLAKTDKWDSYFFASDLINQIGSTEGQEIGCHTFSHYYCREDGQIPEQLAADLKAAKAIAASKGYDIQSLVFPRNQSTAEAIEVARSLGFKAIRSEECDWIHEKLPQGMLKRGFRLADVYMPLTGYGGYIPRGENGVVNLPGSRMYKPIRGDLSYLESVKMKRIKRQMYEAAKNGLCFHLWWHPHNIGIQTEEHLQQIEEIFRFYKKLEKRFGMRSLNMAEIADRIL